MAIDISTAPLPTTGERAIGQPIKPVVDKLAATIAKVAADAGTSSLAIGTTSSSAKAGNYAPAIADVTGLTAALAGKVDGTGITSVVKLTQAAYTALGTPNATTLYVIVG